MVWCLVEHGATLPLPFPILLPKKFPHQYSVPKSLGFYSDDDSGCLLDCDTIQKTTT
jgi:hypothetical protein